MAARRLLPRGWSDSAVQDVDGRLESHFLPEAQAHLVPHVRVQIDLFDATRPEPRERLVHERFPHSPIPLGRIDKQVVDVSVRSVLDEPRPCEDRDQEEADRGPVEFRDEAEAVLVPDVAAREAPPVSLPPGREAILRSTKIGVIVLEPLPHPRERIEIRDPGDPDARLTGSDSCHPPSLPTFAGRDPNVTSSEMPACASPGTRESLLSHRPSRRGDSATPVREPSPRTSASRSLPSRTV